MVNFFDQIKIWQDLLQFTTFNIHVLCFCFFSAMNFET